MTGPYTRPCPVCGNKQVVIDPYYMTVSCYNCKTVFDIDGDDVLKFAAREWNHFATHYEAPVQEECEACKIIME